MPQWCLAPTVAGMLFVVLGVAVGLGITVGPITFLRAPAERLVNALVEGLQRLLHSALQGAPYLAREPKLVTVISVLVGVLAPGIAGLGLVFLMRATVTARRALSAIALLGGIVGLFLLPAADSAPLLIAAIAVGAVASLLTGALLTAPLAALATVLEMRFGLDLWKGHSGPVAAGASTLAQLTHTGHTPLWALALTVCGLAPLICAALVAFKVFPAKSE